STGRIQRGFWHRALDPVPGDGHHRRHRLDHGHADGYRLRGAAPGIDGVDQREPERRRHRQGALAQQQHHVLTRDRDRADHHCVSDVRTRWARASLAADQDLLEALPVFALRLGRDWLQLVSTNNRRKQPMTMKSLLSTVSLALLIGCACPAAQAQIAIGHLADYSGRTSDRGTTYGPALADPFDVGHLDGPSGWPYPARYTLLYGPTSCEAMRALLTGAAEDWKAKGRPGKPKCVHMGANPPSPNAPKAAGGAIAADLGCEVLPPLVFAL